MRGKKILAFIVALGAAMAFFAGCSGGSTSSSQSSSESSETSKAESSSAKSEKTSEPVTVEFWTISLQPTFTDFFNKLIDEYQKENTNVTVKWVDLPYDSIQQKLITASASDTSPDVVNLNTQMALSLAGKGALVDLNKEATDAQKSIYIDTLYNSAKIGDSVYAFPWYASPSVMIYNKDLFEKAGFAATPKTFEEANSMAKTMKDKTGAYLYVPEELTNLLFLNGIDILSSDKTKAAFNNDEAKNLLTDYRKLVEEGSLPKTSWGNWENQLKLFETGKLAIINSSGSSISRIKDEAPDIYEKIGIAEPMTGSAGVVLDPLMNVVVPEKSKNHTAAIDFAAYITNDANQLAFCKEVAIFPSTKVAASDSYFTQDTTTLEGQARAVCAKTLNYSADFSLGIDKQSDVQKQVNSIYEACILGNDDINTKFGSAESEVNKILGN